MKFEDFLKGFADQFDDTDVSEIQAETNFQDLAEWSSLTAMGIIAFVRTKCAKSITGAELRACKTVADLYHFVEEK